MFSSCGDAQILILKGEAAAGGGRGGVGEFVPTLSCSRRSVVLDLGLFACHLVGEAFCCSRNKPAAALSVEACMFWFSVCCRSYLFIFRPYILGHQYCSSHF